MLYSKTDDLLRDVLAAITDGQIRQIFLKLGDRADLNIDEAFGPFGYCWHPFGNNPSNISTVNLGTKPGRSLTERLTNAGDAILEDRAPVGVSSLPRSAREAAKVWFGRPATGADDGLYKWDFKTHDYDRRINVVLSRSGREGSATIDILDDGIGIMPTNFSSTILSLQSGNKIKKWYLMGAFGQGGSSTMAFSDFTIMVSRSRDNPSEIGFTIVKVLRLNEQYKEDTYAFLALKLSDGSFSVPSCNVTAEELDIYGAQTPSNVPKLRQGTMIRHVGYKLPYLDGTLGPGPRNLYHFLHCSMFDPLLPFRVIDLRDSDPSKHKDELVTGSRNRLMSYAENKTTEVDKREEAEEKRTVLKHYRPMEYISPHGSDVPSIGIEYWVVFNYKKSKGGELMLRPQSNELFVQPGHPIIGCLNGQNQGELTSHLFRELNLPLVARHIVVHIDATGSDSRIRRELFATTREGFKDGDVLNSVLSVLKKMLAEDTHLVELEKELNAKLTQKETESTNEEVKRQVTRLLQDAGLEVTKEGPTLEGGSGEEKTQKIPKVGKKPIKPDPLPTLPFPQVTKFDIVVPQPSMEIKLDDIEVVLVETDADAEFDKQGRVTIRVEPQALELASKTPLKGGRVRWRLRPAASAKVGDKGRVIVAITKPDGSQIVDEIDFIVMPPVEQKAKKSKGLVPPFEIIPINPTDNEEQWSSVWPNLPVDTSADELAKVAYKPMQVGGQINVYYSTVFGPFKQVLDKLAVEQPGLIDLFKANYEVWIGYHAILQHNSKATLPVDLTEETQDDLLEQDRMRVAQMQVRQAMKTAELMQKTMQAQAAATTE